MRQILLHASAMLNLVVFAAIGVLWIVLYGRCGRFEAEETFVYTRKASSTVLSCAAALVPCRCACATLGFSTLLCIVIVCLSLVPTH